jgi:hypothetical protein
MKATRFFPGNWLLILLVLSQSKLFAFSTDDAQHIKFEATVMVLEFLRKTTYKESCNASGIKKYGNAGRDSSNLSSHYACILGASEQIIKKIFDQPLEGSSVSIDAFFSYAQSMAEKKERAKKFPQEFEELKTQLNSLKAPNLQRLAGENLPSSQQVEIKEIAITQVPNATSQDKKASALNLNLVIAILAGILALGSLLLQWLSSRPQVTIQKNLKSELEAVQKDLLDTKTALSRIQGVNIKEEVRIAAEETLASFQKNFKPSANQQTSQAIAAQPVITNAPKQESRTPGTEEKSKAPVFTQLYARFASEDRTFSQASLKPQPDSQSVFILKLMENGTGEFYVNNDSTIQVNVALTNFDALFSKIATYSTFPHAGVTKITTRKPGIVKKSGDKWHVTSNVEIEFN